MQGVISGRRGRRRGARPTLREAGEHASPSSLRIDSPGGAVAPSQEIYDADRGGCASEEAGDRVARQRRGVGRLLRRQRAADTIVANPGTLTGSIGVIMEVRQTSTSWLQKLGVRADVVKSGPFKDIGYPLRPMTERSARSSRRWSTTCYAQFVDGGRDGPQA